MKVAVIGSGGREHAICLSLKNSQKVEKIYCIPGNAGTQKIAENIEIEFNNFVKLKDFILDNNINLVIIGPEKPLVDGIVDYLEQFKIKVFGPNKIASQLEGSKIFTKKLCKKNNIPTADFGIFRSIDQSKEFLNKCNYPIVVKRTDWPLVKVFIFVKMKMTQLMQLVKYLGVNLEKQMKF